MRYGKSAVYLFTLLFAVMALLLWGLEPQAETMPMELVMTSGGEEKTITCWKNEAGEYYLFLPGYARTDAARFRIHAADVRIDGKPVEEGMTCGALEPDTSYAFSFDSREGRVDTWLTVLQSENLPAMFIDTGSGTMDHIHGKKGNQEAGRMSLYTPEGTLACIGNVDAINGRGNDWLIPKKSYSIQLAAGADLLGMGQAEKWILLANSFDGSHLRNKLVYDFADRVGLEASPESGWVDLYLNGEYAGLYLLCERNELHEQRIALEGTGKYLVSMDNQWRLEENARPFVTLRSGYAFRIHDTQIHDQTLQQLLQSVEDAISAEDGKDPVTGKHWTELIDQDSWARKYLVEEIFGNGDGGAISQYFYGSADQTPVYAGPVWDYDISMGNAQGIRGGAPNSIFAGRPRVRSNVRLSWYYELYRQDAFREHVMALYRDTCLPLLEEFLAEKLEAYLDLMEQAAVMNQVRWESLGACQTGPAEEAENIRSFMEARIDFLNQLWLEQEPFCLVLIDTNDGHGTTCYAIRPGEYLPDLPEYTPSPEILGWYINGGEEPFDPEQPIYEDMEIILKRAEPESLGEEILETETAGRSLPLKYAPFGLLIAILGGLFWLDRRSRRVRQYPGKAR